MQCTVDVHIMIIAGYLCTSPTHLALSHFFVCLVGVPEVFVWEMSEGETEDSFMSV